MRSTTMIVLDARARARQNSRIDAISLAPPSTVVEKFEADPEAFAPLFPNHCPYNLALGRKAKIDPTNFKIAGDDLLLFHRTEEMDGRERWNEHEDQDELLRRAESNYTLFEF